MPQELLAKSTYQDLLKDIKNTLTVGLLAAQRALEYQRLKTYWEIGRRINLAASAGQIKITQKLYHDISRDIESQIGLELTPDMLGRMVQFQEQYPKFPAKSTLTFTHYLALLRVDDQKERERLEKRAIKDDWAISDLKAAVSKINTVLLPSQSRGKLTLMRGEPYVYCVHQFTNLSGENDLYIDCGFKIDVPLKATVFDRKISTLVDKARVVSVVKKDDSYIVRQDHDGGPKLYTYGATVENVVDADTIDVRIDVGFSIHLYDRLRLRGINSPEMSTPEGKLAKKFLTDYFSQRPLIVLRTYKQKEEMYGRWLADIFALKGSSDPYQIAKEGEFLNQRLLEEGLADLYRN